MSLKFETCTKKEENISDLVMSLNFEASTNKEDNIRDLVMSLRHVLTKKATFETWLCL